ncbi:hypothetical protein P7C70_g6739, partial [Phenoliferia sp. Uapishka_3]
MASRRIIMPGSLEPRPLPHLPRPSHPPDIRNPRTVANRARLFPSGPPALPAPSSQCPPGSGSNSRSSSVTETEEDEPPVVAVAQGGRQLKRKQYDSSPGPAYRPSGVNAKPCPPVSPRASGPSMDVTTSNPLSTAESSSQNSVAGWDAGEWVRIRPKRTCEAFRKSTGKDPLFPREVWVDYNEDGQLPPGWLVDPLKTHLAQEDRVAKLADWAVANPGRRGSLRPRLERQ